MKERETLLLLRSLQLQLYKAAAAAAIIQTMWINENSNMYFSFASNPMYEMNFSDHRDLVKTIPVFKVVFFLALKKAF